MYPPLRRLAVCPTLEIGVGLGESKLVQHRECDLCVAKIGDRGSCQHPRMLNQLLILGLRIGQTVHCEAIEVVDSIIGKLTRLAQPLHRSHQLRFVERHLAPVWVGRKCIAGLRLTHHP